MGVEDVTMKDFKLKPMKCELNYLTKSDGSAILSQGKFYDNFELYFLVSNFKLVQI